VACDYDADAGWFVMERGSIGLAFNLAAETRELQLAGRLLLASARGVRSEGGRLTLPPDAVALIELHR